MGYYTEYILRILNSSEFKNIIKHFRETNEEANYALDEEGEAQESCKWYNSDKDLKNFCVS